MYKNILVVDDDDLMRRSLSFKLGQAGYRVNNAADAESALELAQRDPPNLVLLDIGLPGKDGLEALKDFKQKFGASVIFITARRRELDEVLGLDLGADDYITKPFDLDVLLAHIKAVLRRAGPADQPSEDNGPIVVGDLSLDPLAYTVTVAGKPVELTRREFDLLHTFVLHPDRVLSINDLLAIVWGAEYTGQPQVVYVHIRWLRGKIEDDPDNPVRIINVHSVGYKLIPQGV
jgi:DNA-binding response OmpR family regulator